MSEEEKKRKLLEMWEKEQLANECVRQYLQYRKAKEYIDELEEIIDNAINCINWHYDLGTKEDTAFCWLRDNLLKILGDKENESS